MNFIDDNGLAELLSDATTLDILDDPVTGLRTHVLTFAGQDILAVTGLSGGGAVIYPDSAFDAESGGSIHDHARASQPA